MTEQEKLEEAKRLYTTANADQKYVLESLFPELKENEDERIRKEIISALKNANYKGVYDKHLAWLEKQGQVKESIISQHDNKICKENDNSLTNEDERIIKALKEGFKYHQLFNPTFGGIPCIEIVNWLEKQGNINALIQEASEKSYTEGMRVERKHWVEKQAKIVNEYEDRIDRCACEYFNKGYKAAIEHQKENQDEPKSVDKVEPKFHDGEWLCENEPNNYARFIQILEIVNVQGKERYRISRDIHNDEDVVEFDFVEKYYHKFDIKDAKDGDILCTSGFVFQFKEIRGDGGVSYYCANEKELHEGDNSTFHIAAKNSLMSYANTGLTHYEPATKEQRELLFSKMHEAGYEWDSEKLELIKVPKLKEPEGALKHLLDEQEKLYKEVENILEDKDTALAFLKRTGIIDENGELSEKYRSEQTLATTVTAWSEEDEKMYLSIMSVLLSTIGTDKTGFTVTREVGWLKSLKDRYTWKPSEDEMEALHDMNLTGNISYAGQGQTLIELYNDLKKLREG